MTDPERLLTSTDDDFERRILGVARRDVGSEQALQRTLGALRVAAGASVAATAAKAATAAPLHGAGAAGVTSIGKIAGFVAIGAVAGTLATGGTAWVLAPARPAVTAQAPSPSPLRAPRPVADRAAPPLDEATHRSVETDRVAPAPRATVDKPNTVRTSPSSGDPPSEASSGLGAELGALEGARGALDRGRPALALELIDNYEGRFPNGVLRPEAVVLRIDALARMGDRTTATALARRLLASNPRTPHAAHLQALIAEQR
jgi:hypothetical protein